MGPHRATETEFTFYVAAESRLDRLDASPPCSCDTMNLLLELYQTNPVRIQRVLL